jgi:Na+/H+ antiporter NhaD/arsenite permease-like protein
MSSFDKRLHVFKLLLLCQAMIRYRAPNRPVVTTAADFDDGNAVHQSLDLENQSHEYRLFCKGLSLAIAYGSNIGGIATLTGTPTNLVFKGAADK